MLPLPVQPPYLRAHTFKKEFKAILDWWTKHTIDEVNGGFIGRIDGFGKAHPQADKGLILNARILWTYSAGAKVFEKRKWEKLADRAFRELLVRFVDSEYGGVYWSVDHTGVPVATKKEIYAQSFAIYAFSQYYLLTGKPDALLAAQAIFALLLEHSHDPENGGFFDAFTREWEPTLDGRLSPPDVPATKTMNTHLHLMEAFTNLYRVDRSNPVREALAETIQLFLDKIIDPQTHHERLFFADDWTSLTEEVSYGHDIECSWLLWEAAEVLGDEALIERVKPVSLAMAKATLQQGLDAQGALMYERHADGHLNTDLHWWPQAEAVVGFWNAYQLSGDEQYAKAAARVWRFIQGQLIDRQRGEWFGRVDKLGEPNLSGDKAGPWKAPYHNGRMCLEMMRRLGLT